MIKRTLWFWLRTRKGFEPEQHGVQRFSRASIDLCLMAGRPKSGNATHSFPTQRKFLAVGLAQFVIKGLSKRHRKYLLARPITQ